MKNRYTRQGLQKFNRIFLIMLLLLFLFNQSKAQLVYIPDANFRIYISNLNASAIIGDSLDITNQTVTTTEILNIQPQGIQNLSGIEYFTSLRKLECYDNALNTLNAVPFSLDTLLIENALITTLPMLPNSMIWLGCAFCPNLAGFSNLPSGLISLGISLTAINIIFALPANLQFLECVGTPLIDLPPLPQSLLLLNCQSSTLTCLPRLPDGMVQLWAASSGVTCLPNIPTNVNFTSDIGLNLCYGLQSAFATTPISCFGSCDGELLAVTTGGVALDYYWSNGVFDLNNATGVSGISSLCAGNYFVEVIASGGGCYTRLTTSLSQPTQQQLGQPIVDPMGCSDDSTWVYYPGNPPFSFQWSTGAIADSVYLPVGTYTVTVLAGGCGVLPASFTISANTILVSAIANNITCNGNSDGTITAVATGGTPPYLYVLNSILLPWQTSGVFNNLLAGTYVVHAMDSNFCVGSTTLTITQPSLITINTLTTDATCGLADGSITINVLGGISPYAYSIDNGVTYQALSVFSNVASGAYTVSVQDANGCFANIQTIVSGIGGPVINNLVPTNTSCFNSNDGSITVNVTGGTLPYQYSADTGITQSLSNVLMNLNAGTYMIVVADAGGCRTTANTVITSPSAITISTTVDNVTCNGTSTGSICANASGGTGAYTYLWSNATITQCQNNLIAGIYTVTVTDANNCFTSATTTVSEPPPLSFGNILANYLVCNLNPVNICFTVTGGTPGYTYLWSQGSVTNCISASVGVYTITVVDVNGCSLTASTSVTFATGWQFASVTNLILPTCGMCDGSAEVIMTNTQATSYQWLPGNITTAINSQLCDNGSNTVIVTDTAGCVDTVNFTLSCHSVWPGDANNDGQADNTDLLAIGIGYGATGDSRENATISWQSEKGFDWADSLASGTNYKHIDCNGDGVSADDDTTAIIQNFGLTHPLHPALITSILTDPPFYFDLQIDSTNIDTILQIPIMLGSAAIPADSIYGIAFTVSYDTALVKADSMTINFNTCWMNSATGHTIGIGINDPSNGKLYAAVTRTSHTDTSGYGELARLGVVTVDNISARMSSLRSDTLIFTLSDVILITHDEQYKTVNIINDSLILNDNTVSIAEHNESFALNVYPNPTTRFLFMDYDAQLKTPAITLRSLLNEEITINYKASNGKAIVDLGTIANGFYFVTVFTDKGFVVKKISLQVP